MDQPKLLLRLNILAHPITRDLEYLESLRMIAMVHFWVWWNVQLYEYAPGLFEDHRIEDDQQPEAQPVVKIVKDQNSHPRINLILTNIYL